MVDPRKLTQQKLIASWIVFILQQYKQFSAYYYTIFTKKTAI